MTFLEYMTQFCDMQAFAVMLGVLVGGAVIYLISDYKLPSKTFPFVIYLRKNVAIVLAILLLMPLLTALAWWFAEDIRSACTISTACILWIFVGQYGIFAVTDSSFKKDLIGVSGALVVGYVVFLLFSSVGVSPLGMSKGYFFASLSILLYYLGRYIGINNGLPILKKLFVYLGLPVPPDKR